MPASELKDLSRLAVHTMTNKPWSLAECIEHYQEAGVPGITVWRNVVQEVGPDAAARMLAGSDLDVVAYVRGGFFPALDEADRRKAIADNLRCLDEAAAIGAPMVVLVCGAVPGMALNEARAQILDGIEAILPHAERTGVTLAVEPLHPMYAADRSAINTMRQARQVCEHFRSGYLGVAVDVYHVWWDPDLELEIRLAGIERTLFAFHICDWRVETRSLLTDRGLMGEGCIDLRRIRGWMEAAGFDGRHEVEIFSDEHWAGDQAAYLEEVKRAYLAHA